jgi:hypothetical protein
VSKFRSLEDPPSLNHSSVWPVMSGNLGGFVGIGCNACVVSSFVYVEACDVTLCAAWRLLFCCFPEIVPSCSHTSFLHKCCASLRQVLVQIVGNPSLLYFVCAQQHICMDMELLLPRLSALQHVANI